MRGNHRPSRVRVTACAVLALVAAGCTTHSTRVADFRAAYGSARFEDAEARLDPLIADEADVPVELVRSSQALASEIDSASGDTFLLQLERSMTRLALGDTGASIDLMRRGRKVLDERLQLDATDYAKSILTDDTALPYRGADYEHVVLRAMLALVDLLEGGADAYSYALQLGEKQEEILASDVGVSEEDFHYNPREHYRRVAIGKYIEGVVQEANLERDAAARSYRTALEFAGGGNPLLQAAVERTTTGRFAPEGFGAVHVFYLVGRGPHLIEVENPTTDLASRIAGITIAIAGDKSSALFQAPVKVPAVVISDARPAPLRAASGGRSADTVGVLDMNRIAIEQTDARAPMVMARAIARRSIKAGVAAVTESAVRKTGSGNRYDLGFAVGAIANLVMTAAETADTRNWSSLPAQIQACRLELPQGHHVLELSDGGSIDVKVNPGRDTYVVVVRPDLSRPGAVLVDKYSRAEAPGWSAR